MLFLILLQLTSFISFGIDKKRAIKHQYRISERTLLILAYIAPLGAFIGMFLFHHKTRKIQFLLVTSLSFLLQSLSILYLLSIGYITLL